MCGIVGIIGKTDVALPLLECLKRLEYRGYDSAGIATIDKGLIERRRAEGKLINLATRLNDTPLFGKIGIGHTRWATHGVPNEVNEKLLSHVSPIALRQKGADQRHDCNPCPFARCNS